MSRRVRSAQGALLFFLVGALLVATGCAGAGEEQADDRPLEVALPPFENVEPQTREDLEREHAALQALAAEPDAPAERLAAAYGSFGAMCHLYDFARPAEAAYRNAAALVPQEFRWPYYLGHMLAVRGELERAREFLERAVELRPDYPAARVRLGELYLELGLLDVAAREFESALALNESEASALAGLGKVAREGGDHAGAAAYLERALELSPQADSLHYPLAMSYRALGNSRQAEDHLARRGPVKLSPHDPVLDEVLRGASGKQVHVERGETAARAGHLQTAETEFRQALEADPDDWLVRLHLGDVLGAQDRREESLAEYRAAERLAPDEPKVHLRLGRMAALEGDDATAIVHFQRVVEREPGSRRAHLELARALQRSNRQEDALRHYRIVLEADPSNAEARFGRAGTLVRLGRHAQAKAAIEDDIAAVPDQRIFLHILARLLAASPDDDVRDGPRALAIVEQLGRERPHNELAQTWAMALATLGRYDEAVRVQRIAVDGASEAGRADLLRRLQANLALYERGRPCRVPWEDGDPFFSPGLEP